jgi:NHLM bacteriocin system ABC transporter ATP-binding protein
MKKREQRIDQDQAVFTGALQTLAGILKKDDLLPLSEDAVERDLFAIQRILRFFDLPLGKLPEGLDDASEKLDYILSPTGIMRRRVELTDKWWQNTTGPLLGALKEDGSPIAFIPNALGQYDYFDFNEMRKVKISKKTKDNFETDAFCFYPALPAKKMALWDLSKFMLGQLNALDIILILLMCLAVSVLGLFMPYMNQQIFNNVIPSGTKSDVFPIAVLLLGATLGSALFQISRNMVLTRLKDKVTLAMQSATMARLFSLPTSFYKQFTAGEISHRVMGIQQLSMKLSDTVLSTLLTALFSLIYILQMMQFAPALVLPGFIIILTMLSFTLVVGYVQQQLMRGKLQIAAKLEGFVFSLFSGVQKIKLAGAEKRAFAKWASYYKVQGKLTFTPPMLIRLNQAFSAMLVLGGAIILYFYSVKYQVSVSNFIAFQVSYGIVSGAIISLSDVVMTFAQTKPLMEMVEPILSTIPETDESKLQVSSLSGKIELSNITFKYDEDGPNIINHLTCQIHSGEYVAIVGGSGSGKSTLMRLLLGFEKPTSGAVYYDGQDLDMLDVRSVRQRIGTCLQDGKLFGGDIFSNIIVTAPWSTLDDAWEAARLAGFDEDIKNMPMGMHTMISEGSGNISGGQKQRILIARALIARPNILFFDEATSALDNITQRIVTDNIDQLGCTRIVIAHRLSTVLACDRIIVLDKGVIAEEGSYETLMAHRGLFYDFAVRQMT